MSSPPTCPNGGTGAVASGRLAATIMHTGPSGPDAVAAQHVAESKYSGTPAGQSDRCSTVTSPSLASKTRPPLQARLFTKRAATPRHSRSGTSEHVAVQSSTRTVVGVVLGVGLWAVGVAAGVTETGASEGSCVGEPHATARTATRAIDNVRLIASILTPCQALAARAANRRIKLLCQGARRLTADRGSGTDSRRGRRSSRRARP
jgi:hypothetical protein